MGYVAVLIATLFFGSNFVPVKRYETYDGMFYQWVMCAAIWMTGLVIQLVLFAVPPDADGHWDGDHWNATAGVETGRPDAYSVKFFPMAALGGALWATGNTLSVPVINYIGLSLGLLIWGSANMLMGWATGVFGLFTGQKDYLEYSGENYAGVALAVLALGMYTFIRTEDSPAKPAADTIVPANGSASYHQRDAPDVVLLDVAPEKKRTDGKVVGICMAVCAGILFGNTFTPPNYLMDKHLGPASPMDYIFSHFTGIFATSTVWFVLYCCYMRGSPKINHRLTLPGMLSGVMWAIAQTCWFVANDALSVSVAFPIITSGPGIVSAMWGVFVFGEIKGTRNFAALGVAIVLAVTGCILIGLSKGTAPSPPSPPFAPPPSAASQPAAHDLFVAGVLGHAAR